MAQPTAPITSARAAATAARAVELPSQVMAFEALAAESPSVRAHLQTPEWQDKRSRILGDGSPPLGRPDSLGYLARLFRWMADGAFDAVSADEQRAYIHCAHEVEAFDRSRSAHLSVVPDEPVAGAAA